MKRLIFVVFVLIIFGASKPIDNCNCKNIPLFGDVKFVTGRSDFTVKVVNHHQDLSVKVITTKPKKCGEWRIVEKNPTFTVRIVEHHADFTIKYVDHHQGLN